MSPAQHDTLPAPAPGIDPEIVEAFAADAPRGLMASCRAGGEANDKGDRTMSRKEEARRLANAAIVVATSTSGKPAAVRVGSLDILLTAQGTGEVGMSGRYVVDIWSESAGGRKVFSAYWDGSPDDESFGVVYFDRGPWSLDLEQAAKARATK